MAIFSLFKYNQSNRIDVRIGNGTVKITTILTVKGMITSKKNCSGGQEINRGAMPPMPPPAGDAPELQCMYINLSFKFNYNLNFGSTFLKPKVKNY